MIPETTPITFETKYGTLYVAVMAAREDSYHDRDRGNVIELRPRVRVASDPTFKADPKHEQHWTIRRRAYAVHQTFYLWDRTMHGGDLWHKESAPYPGGYIDDRGGSVDFRTATWDLMDETVRAVLVEFHARFTGWEELSRYLLLKYKHDSEASKAEYLRAQANKHEAEAMKLAGDMAPVLSATPYAVRALLRD